MPKPTADVDYELVGPDEALALLDELCAIYRQVYREPPYNWGDDHVALFRERFQQQARSSGFALVAAQAAGHLIGFIFGVTLKPESPWWQGLITDAPAELVEERPDRTFAVVELVVLPEWRQQGVASHLHELLLADRHEERATLTVLPAATAAQQAYRRWGWTKVARKRNPLPGAPEFDLMIKELNAPGVQ